MTLLPSIDIQCYLPHRYPFLLIDKVLEIIPKKKIIVLKNVTANEPFFQGHFPENPMMPGVLIIEAMAQAGNLLATYPAVLKNASSKSKYVLAAIESVKFKRSVFPGDQLQIVVEVQWQRSSFIKWYVQATVDDHIICVGQITGAQQSSSFNKVD